MVYNDELINIKNSVLELVDGLLKANELLLDGFKECDTQIFEQSKKNISNFNSKTNAIDNDIIRVLALYSPEAKDLREVVGFLKITNEILRASANTRSVIKGFIAVCQDIDEQIIDEYMIPMQKSTIKAISLVEEMFNISCEDDLKDTFNDILVQESKTDDFYDMIQTNIVDKSSQDGNFEIFHKILQTIRKGEKISDRITNIGNIILYIKIGGKL